MKLLRGRFERHARGWTRALTAVRADITLRALDRIETNSNPDPEALRALAAVFGFPADVAHVLLEEVPSWPDPGAPGMREKLLVAIRAKREEEERP